MTTDYSALQEAHHDSRYGQTANIAGRLVALGVPHSTCVPKGDVRVVRVVLGGLGDQMLPILVFSPFADLFEGPDPFFRVGDAVEFRGTRLTRTNKHYERDWCFGRSARRRPMLEPLDRESIPGDPQSLGRTPIALGDIGALRPVEVPLLAVSGDVVAPPRAHQDTSTPVTLSDLSGRRTVWFPPEVAHLVRHLTVGCHVRLERVHLIGFAGQYKGGRVLRAGLDTLVVVEADLRIPLSPLR